MKRQKVDLFFSLLLISFAFVNFLGAKTKCPFYATGCDKIFCGQKANILCCQPKHIELLPLFGRKTAHKIWSFINERSITSLEELSQIRGIGKKKLKILESYFFVSEKCVD